MTALRSALNLGLCALLLAASGCACCMKKSCSDCVGCCDSIGGRGMACKYYEGCCKPEIPVCVCTGDCCCEAGCGCEVGCGCEPECCVEPECCAEPECCCEPCGCGDACCKPTCCLDRVRAFLNKGCCKPACGCEVDCCCEPECCAEPDCCTEPECCCEPDCCTEADCCCEPCGCGDACCKKNCFAEVCVVAWLKGMKCRMSQCMGGCCGCAGCDGEVYWNEWHNDPPRCCDPCDKCGNWIGPSTSYRAPYDHPYSCDCN